MPRKTPCRSGRGRRWLRCVAWVVLAYLCVGSLHGLAPGLWERYYGPQHENGPFRVLLFTQVITTGVAVLLLLAVIVPFAEALPVASPAVHAVWTPWSLRGPPGRV